MKPLFWKTLLLALSFASYLFGSGIALAQAANVRLLVSKNLTPNRPLGSPLPPFAIITSGRPAAAGFTQIADYPSRALYEGPASAAASLVSALGTEGYRARIATDLENVFFHDRRIDPDTGVATPPFPPSTYTPTGTDGLYLMVLRGYPAAQWLQDLRSRNVRLLEALPPAAYLVRGARSRMATLKSQVPYVRGLFPIAPVMKPFLASPTPSSPFRRVLVRGVEETPQDVLKPYLDSVSQRPSILDAKVANGRVSYVASLSDLAINNLTLFENVYSVAEISEPRPSSERQGLLALSTIADGPLELPPINFVTSSYQFRINQANIFDFNNTTVAIIDTGFDNGTNTHPDFQYFGTPSVTNILSEVGDDGSDSRDGHGTMVASVITGFRFFGERFDPEQYGYGMGLGFGVKLISDKFFSCSGSGDFATALGNVGQFAPNVVNISFNDRLAGSCGYTVLSGIADQRSRDYLLTISAGNTPDSPPCLFVRGPATGKNVLAVGASENFTFNYPPGDGMGTTCPWNRQPAVRDARHIPSFSAKQDPTSMVKPDLVAPGTRVTGPVSRVARCLTIFCNPDVQSFVDPPVTYGMSAGTSFAAPAVAGAAAVARKWYHMLNPTRPNPSPALTKAILINGARDVGGAPASPPCPAAAVRDADFVQIACVGHIPDQYQGWGMLSLTRLLGPASNYFFSDQDQHPVLTPTTTFWETPVTVNDGTRPVRITLVYSDAPGNMGVTPYGVKNDISLGAYQSACFPCWIGNNFNAFTGFTTPNSFNNDGVNNVEEIIIPPGWYPSGAEIRIFVQAVSLTADAISGGPDPQQDFAIFLENAR